MFECIKSGLLWGSPAPFGSLTGECMKGLGNVREVFDEPSVEVGESEERLHFFHLGRDRPISNSFYLHWVHRNMVFRDDEPQVLDYQPFKFTFFSLQKQVMFPKKC